MKDQGLAWLCSLPLSLPPTCHPLLPPPEMPCGTAGGGKERCALQVLCDGSITVRNVDHMATISDVRQGNKRQCRASVLLPNRPATKTSALHSVFTERCALQMLCACSITMRNVDRMATIIDVCQVNKRQCGASVF